MSKRYGRNQRRKHREQIAALETQVIETRRSAFRDVMTARVETERVRKHPLNQIKERALSYLAGRTADAIEKARGDFLKQALVELERAGLAGLEFTASDRVDAEPSRSTVFMVRVPGQQYHFVADLRALADNEFPV